MNFRQFEVFEAVMRTGSLSEAARALGVTQPAVSKSLRLTEQAAGFVLFRRRLPDVDRAVVDRVGRGARAGASIRVRRQRPWSPKFAASARRCAAWGSC